MPCYDPRNDEDERRVRRELNERTAMLCDLCKRLEPLSPELIEANPALAEWWREHKEFDKQRAPMQTENQSSKPEDLPQQETCSTWLPIETVPKEGKFDVCAKVWLPAYDKFRVERFTNCIWSNGDTLTGRRPGILGIPDSHRATHWMPIPSLPNVSDDRQLPGSSTPNPTKDLNG